MYPIRFSFWFSLSVFLIDFQLLCVLSYSVDIGYDDDDNNNTKKRRTNETKLPLVRSNAKQYKLEAKLPRSDHLRLSLFLLSLSLSLLLLLLLLLLLSPSLSFSPNLKFISHFIVLNENPIKKQGNFFLRIIFLMNYLFFQWRCGDFFCFIHISAFFIFIYDFLGEEGSIDLH